MRYTVYYYLCSCGKNAKSPNKNPNCYLCGKLICNKCERGGICPNCRSRLPYDLQEKTKLGRKHFIMPLLIFPPLMILGAINIPKNWGLQLFFFNFIGIIHAMIFSSIASAIYFAKMKRDLRPYIARFQNSHSNSLNLAPIPLKEAFKERTYQHKEEIPISSETKFEHRNEWGLSSISVEEIMEHFSILKDQGLSAQKLGSSLIKWIEQLANERGEQFNYAKVFGKARQLARDQSSIS